MFGSYMKAARLRAGVSVPAAASAAGIGEDAVYRYERDANSPSIEVLDKLAAAYGCLAGDLLPNSGSGAGTRFREIEAALMGLSDEEIDEQILELASHARLSRNALMRRLALASTAKPDATALSLVQTNISVDSKSSHPYISPPANLGGEGTRGDVPGVAWARKPAVGAAHVDRTTGEGRAAGASSRAKKDAKKR